MMRGVKYPDKPRFRAAWLALILDLVKPEPLPANWLRRGKVVRAAAIALNRNGYRCRRVGRMRWWIEGREMGTERMAALSAVIACPERRELVSQALAEAYTAGRATR